jgi:hypothetical protein
VNDGDREFVRPALGYRSVSLFLVVQRHIVETVMSACLSRPKSPSSIALGGLERRPDMSSGLTVFLIVTKLGRYLAEAAAALALPSSGTTPSCCMRFKASQLI